MRTLLILCLIFAATLLAAQQPPGDPSEPIEPPIASPELATPPLESEEETTAAQSVSSAGSGRINEFQGDDVSLVLRTLARQTGANLVVSDRVAKEGGTVTMRLENKTPMEAIEIIVLSKGLIMDEVNGIYFIKTATEMAKEPTSKSLDRITRELVGPLARLEASYYKGLIDAGIPPETASQMVIQEELSKRALAPQPALVPAASESESSTSWFSGWHSSKHEGWLTAGAIASAVIGTIPQIMLHVIFAIAVWCSALGVARRGNGESLTFFNSFFWALATLVGGVLVAALYWLIHLSTLRRTLAPSRET